MSGSRRKSGGNTMLELWRPPHNAGDPVGCLTTTYTFSPGLFDEQCLARFLGIESEPNREDLAFLLERENRLGAAYAGVLIDHTQAGVEHSLRWDVLPVRIRGAKQHAKISLLAWSRHVRIIVASANLTDPGYRTNFEVAGTVECTPEDANKDFLSQTIAFLWRLLHLVPAAADRPPELARAEQFLDRVEKQVGPWEETSQRGQTTRQALAFTLPAAGSGRPAQSALDAAIATCRARGGSPDKSYVASPFFDPEGDENRTTAALCKAMARGSIRELFFCLPGTEESNTVRLFAPKSLILTAREFRAKVTVETLPESEDKNVRPWHAKMLGLDSEKYFALMIGSSNFTRAGLGLKEHCNAEANLVTIVDRVRNSREPGALTAIWPATRTVINPDSAEWIGAKPDEDEQSPAQPLPTGFLGATYRAGDKRSILIRLDPGHLPESWHILACGSSGQELFSSTSFQKGACPSIFEVDWAPVQPPERLLVRWTDDERELEAFLPLNIEDHHNLPPPPRLEAMTADEMLQILAASDPGGAIRAWARRQQPALTEDDELDSAIPADLDPLRRHDIQTTYLHRIRQRARVLARLRANLQRPVWGAQALEWRLRGLVGIEPLADRRLREYLAAEDDDGESLLTLADLLIVLQEVDYQPGDGYMSKKDFEGVYRPFLKGLAERLDKATAERRRRLPKDLSDFWNRVVTRCVE